MHKTETMKILMQNSITHFRCKAKILTFEILRKIWNIHKEWTFSFTFWRHNNPKIVQRMWIANVCSRFKGSSKQILQHFIEEQEKSRFVRNAHFGFRKSEIFFFNQKANVYGICICIWFNVRCTINDKCLEISLHLNQSLLAEKKTIYSLYFPLIFVFFFFILSL